MAKPKTKKPETAYEIVNHTDGGRELHTGDMLLPGANRVSRETFETVKSHPYLKKLIARRQLELREINGEPTEQWSGGELPFSCAELTLDSMQRAVQACSDEDTLNLWLNLDGRPETRHAILTRVAALRPKPPEEDND